jgi:hypothetical protein
MRYSFAAAALAAAAVTGVNCAAMPQASSSSSGCSPNSDGSFEIKVITGQAPKMGKRSQVCHLHPIPVKILD